MSWYEWGTLTIAGLGFALACLAHVRLRWRKDWVAVVVGSSVELTNRTKFDALQVELEAQGVVFRLSRDAVHVPADGSFKARIIDRASADDGEQAGEGASDPLDAFSSGDTRLHIRWSKPGSRRRYTVRVRPVARPPAPAPRVVVAF